MNPRFDFQAAVLMARGGTVIGTSELSGDANGTYVAHLRGGGRLVIRILRTLTPDRARHEVCVQQALTTANIATPISLVLRGGDVVGCVSDLHFTASHFIEGQHPAVITRALAVELGRSLAVFHQATQALVIEGTSWMSPLDMAREVQSVRDREFREGLEEMQRSASDLFCADLPEANIHGDVWPGNVFSHADHVTAVLDLETVERAPRIIDIGRTAVALVAASTQTPEQLLQLLVSGYDAVEPLSDKEIDLLPLAYRHATIASAAWNIEHGHPEHARAMFQRARDLDRVVEI